MLRLFVVLIILCGTALGVIFIIRALPKIFLHLTVAASMAIEFVAKKFLLAVSWTFCAIGAVTVGLFALVRQHFTNRDAKFFIERFLSQRNSPHEKTFPLLTIGLMLELHEKLAEMSEKICRPAEGRSTP